MHQIADLLKEVHNIQTETHTQSTGVIGQSVGHRPAVPDDGAHTSAKLRPP